jgi:predicted nuclease with TOPRIM domain
MTENDQPSLPEPIRMHHYMVVTENDYEALQGDKNTYGHKKMPEPISFDIEQIKGLGDEISDIQTKQLCLDDFFHDLNRDIGALKERFDDLENKLERLTKYFRSST